MNEAASKLIEQIRDGLEADIVSLRAQYPSCRFSLSLDSNLALCCLRPDVPAEMPDEVALIIDFVSVAASERVMADITWGHPSGHIEDSILHEWHLSEDWPLLTPEIAATIIADMPRLRESFRRAVARGFPS